MSLEKVKKLAKELDEELDNDELRPDDRAAIMSRQFEAMLLSGWSLPNTLRSNHYDLAIHNDERYQTDSRSVIITAKDLAKSDVRHNNISLWLENEDVDFSVGASLWRHEIKAQGLSEYDPVESYRNVRERIAFNISSIETEQFIFCAAGARGHEYNPKLNIMPLDSDQFRKAMINPVMAPSFDRHFYAGDATDFDGQRGSALSQADKMSFSTLKNTAENIKQLSVPIQKIKLPGLEDGVYLMIVTPRQWEDIKRSVSSNDWLHMRYRADCLAKDSDGYLLSGHPKYLLTDNLLIRKYSKPVRFYPGLPLNISDENNEATTHEARLSKDADFLVDRAIIFGAGAIIEGWGGVKRAAHVGENMPLRYEFWESYPDEQGLIRFNYKAMSGIKKLRIISDDGRYYDNGVAVLDSVVMPK